VIKMQKLRIQPDHERSADAPCARDVRVNLAAMLRTSFMVAMLTASGCSSSDFDTPATDTDAATADTASADGDVVSEAAPPGPCDPEPGKAKYCVEVKLAKTDHPPYTMSSGALGLGLDGLGKVALVLWDKDPASTPAGEKSPPPKYVVGYPADEKAQIGVDKDFPVTVSGEADEGTYTVAALFADNLKERVNGESLPGDFLVLPTIVEGKPAYPKMTVKMGEVQKTTLELYPSRRLTVTLALDAGFTSYARMYDSVHGDGPTMLAIFDGDPSDYSKYLHVSFSPCVYTNVQKTLTNSPILDVTTTVVGPHDLLVYLFDYTSEPFPGRGTISSTPVAPFPRVDIKSDSWTASALVDLKKIPSGPVTSGTPDPLTCSL
jgi:hypothetical protein